jgi:hypothetical protein
MKRDEYWQKGGSMEGDLEEKEGSADSFESHARPHQAQEKPANSSKDRALKAVHFVNADDDPNMHISRSSSDLTELPRSAGKNPRMRKGDTKIVARPQGPIMEEGAVIRPLTPTEGEEAEDS